MNIDIFHYTFCKGWLEKTYTPYISKWRQYYIVSWLNNIYYVHKFEVWIKEKYQIGFTYHYKKSWNNKKKSSNGNLDFGQHLKIKYLSMEERIKTFMC